MLNISFLNTFYANFSLHFAMEVILTAKLSRRCFFVGNLNYVEVLLGHGDEGSVKIVS